MIDLRKILVILVIAVLFSILVFSTIDAVYPRPEYSDYCGKPIMDTRIIYPDSKNCTVIIVPDQEISDCDEKKGHIEYKYDSLGCPIDYSCNTCQIEYDDARDKYNLVVFMVSALLGIVAVILGMYLPKEPNTINEWVGTGFMLGGVFALFFGTAQSYNSLDRYLRPIIIFIELALVVFISYKQLGDRKIDSKNKKR